MFSHFLSIICVIFFIQGALAEEMVYITIGSDAIPSLSQKKILLNKSLRSEKGITLLSVPKSKILEISELMHDEFNRCGGFIYHPNYEKAQQAFIEPTVNKEILADYSINREAMVNSFIEKISSENILETIKKLSSFPSRYYGSENGVSSQNWIKSQWEAIIKNRQDARVELFNHEYAQPSIIVTIQGIKSPEEMIIFGGHGDSIATSRGDREREMKAPGADDNASGIAVLTEILRVIIEGNYRPEKTIKIISYAAEEVGLRGSNEIATRMKSIDAKIVGVIQFDMTNFIGPDGKINLISDFTNSNQNAFLGKLIDKYVKSPWGYGKCGYACSDHASWTQSGFIASFPFEASMNGHNPHIHTKGDTLEKSQNVALHATKFAKLGVSYLIELDK
jgi:bacterial leucyl aminopeptidase